MTKFPMSTTWKTYLKHATEDTDWDKYVPFKFKYAIKTTENSILFKLGAHRTSFVPKSQLIYDICELKGKDWIYITKWMRDNLIADHANVNLEL